MTYKEFLDIEALSEEEIDPEQLIALKKVARREVLGISRAESFRWIAENATNENWWYLCNEKAAEVEERLQP